MEPVKALPSQDHRKDPESLGGRDFRSNSNRSAFLDALDVREVLVERENQRGGRSDLKERNRESGEHLGRPRVLFREG
ncbi:UNVERIFIED_CONTAM: hypothetical protein FKN15_027307 [Acipenser sinensis]